MRVAFPYPAYWPYARRGIERCIHDVAGFLSRRGHEVHVITSTPGRARVAYEDKVKVTYLPQLNHPLVFRYRPGLRQATFAARASIVLARERADVAHLWNWSLPWAPLVRRRLDLPYLFQVGLRGARLIPRTGRGPFRRLDSIDLRHADRVVALTPGGAGEVEVKFGVPCGVLPPPVDMDFFRPVALRAARPHVLFTSDLTDPLKGGRLLLRAWNFVHRSCPEAVLALAGPYGMAGYTRAPLDAVRSVVGELVDPAARATVELRGPGTSEELPDWYSRAWVTVLPSVGEAFGMVLTESLACGTPVVSSSREGPGEIVTNPEVGRTFDLRTQADLAGEERAGELAHAILAAIQLAGDSQTSGRCREWASRWSLDRVGAEEERLLAEVIEGRARAAMPAPATSR